MLQSTNKQNTSYVCDSKHTHEYWRQKFGAAGLHLFNSLPSSL